MSRGMFFYNECEEQSPSNESDHVAESCCYLCARPFFEDSDIYMYRGNKPFCSDDCRQEQIDFDEANERKRVKKAVAMSESERAIISNDLRWLEKRVFV